MTKKEKAIKQVRDKVYDYIDSVVTGARLAGELEKLSVQRYLNDKATGHQRPEEERIYFDTDDAVRSVLFFNTLHHFKGEMAGKPFVLPGWQAFIIWNLFGWKKTKTEKRRFTEAYIEVAKKNGKSTFAAGIATKLLVADREAAPEVYSAATTRDQASIVFDTAKEMIKRSPKILEKVKLWTKSIAYEDIAGYIQPVSSEAGNVEGKNSHGAIVDEYHLHKTSEVKDNLRSGMAGRAQPLLITITTAGYNRYLPCYRKRETMVQILKGQLIDDSQFTMIYTIDENDDWDNPKVWEKANPNLGVNPSIDFLLAELKTAQNEGGEKEVSFKTKHLNIWTDAAAVWIQDDVWMKGDKGPLPLDELKTAKAYAGLDLSSTRDITAYVLVFPFDDIVYILPYFWIPEMNYMERVKKDNVNYDIWVKAGLIRTTPGNTVDYDYIERDILQINEEFNVQQTAYDRYNSSSIVAHLIEKGLKMEPFGQGFVSMNAPTKEIEVKAYRGEFSHVGNPVLRWMCSNVDIKRDAAGNIKIDKDKSSEKVDGMVSLAMALGISIAPEEDDNWVESW